MTGIFKPMLAATLKSLDDLPKGSYLAQPKYDGIRCLFKNGQALSRKLKPIPNKHIQDTLKSIPNLEGADGELILKTGSFNESQSAIMTKEGKPDFTYFIFDSFLDKQICQQQGPIQFVQSLQVESKEEIERLLNIYLKEGYEGIMLRKFTGKHVYKYGRSTLKEGYLIKYKIFQDADGVVLDVQQRFENLNEKELDNLGHTKRSSKMEGLSPIPYAGSFLVKGTSDSFVDKEFLVNIAVTDEERKKIWENKETYKGKEIVFKYQQEGLKDKPRFPIWDGRIKEE